MTVTTSGPTPQLARRRPTGSTTRATRGRKFRLSMARPPYRRRSSPDRAPALVRVQRREESPQHVITTGHAHEEAVVMAEKHAPAGAAGTAPVAAQPAKVRNVVLVGHSGAGKTTLAEALLLATGTIGRMGRVEDGSTTTDYDDAEIRQQRSVSLALAPFEHGGIKVNLLDTPGYADFVGDLRAGLRAADAALFVVSAADGVDGMTQLIWEECAAVGMPRAVVITKLDSPRGDFEQMVEICQRVLGGGNESSVLPLYLPLHADDESVGGLIGLLSQKVFDYS